MKKCPQCYDKNFKEHSEFDRFCTQCGSKLEIKKNKYEITIPLVFGVDCVDDLTVIEETNKIIRFFNKSFNLRDTKSKVNINSTDISRDGKFVHFKLKKKNEATATWCCGCGHNHQTLAVGKGPNDVCQWCGCDDDYHIIEEQDDGYTIWVE